MIKNIDNKYSFLKNKNILYIPVISMRSYETNKYDLSSDGNVNRFISFFSKLNFDFSVSIILPNYITDTSKSFINKVNNDKIHFIFTDSYPIGGASAIRDYNKSDELFTFISDIIYQYNFVIYESQSVGLYIENTVKEQYLIPSLYWCVVSCTKEIQPDFIKKYDNIDKELINKATYTIVATEKQKEYFNNNTVIVDNNFIDLSLNIFSFNKDYDIISIANTLIESGYRIFYIPFRLSDTGYKCKEIQNILNHINSKIAVLYSDPNDSKIYDSNWNTNIKTIKVSKNRNTYYTILSDVDCIIPYFEDIKNILHVSWCEMKYFKCNLITKYEDTLEKNISNFIHIMNQKKYTLYIIEGFDRIGKDTIIDNYFDNIYSFKMNPTNYDKVDYHNRKEYKKWLKKYLDIQCNLLLDKNSNIIMSRLFISDYVYSSLFDRENIAENKRNFIYRKYNIVNIILLWKNYNEYLNRLKQINDNNIEYTEEEFNSIQLLYKEAQNDLSQKDKYIYIDNITSDMSKEKILEKIKQIIYNKEEI